MPYVEKWAHSLSLTSFFIDLNLKGNIAHTLYIIKYLYELLSNYYRPPLDIKIRVWVVSVLHASVAANSTYFLLLQLPPFNDFKKMPEGNPYEGIMPFSIKEQKLLIANMPDHWKPYFLFAFCTGLRQGEQIGLKPHDVDWENQIIHVRRGITKDENGKTIEGPTKNIFSRRDIRFTPVIRKALEAQKAVYQKFNGEYFFCSPEGQRVHPQNLGRRVWFPVLKKAKILFREMKQTRHSFATMALSYGENPLWVASTMGHRDTDMVIKVYSKFVRNASGKLDGGMLDQAYQFVTATDKDEEGQVT
jgi:hypothetical protein